MKKVATVALLCRDRLLVGRRSDDGRWNLPGGHVDSGESPVDAALRELKEETGISLLKSQIKPLREPKKVNTFTGKELEVHAFYANVPTELACHRNGSDPGEAHDWSWINIQNGLPPDISMNWHNKDDAALEALGLGINPMDIDKQEDGLEKAWPKKYERVAGQDKNKGVSSERQKRFMQAVASGKASGPAPSPEEAKAYLKNTGGGELPESGTGGARGSREKERAKRREEKKKKKQSKEIKKSEDSVRVARELQERSKAKEKPKPFAFADQVKRIKQKYAELPEPSFEEQVARIKEKYSKFEKAQDMFYAKIEGCLSKGTANEELISNLLDMDILFKNNEASCMELYKSADKYFDAVLSPEEQAVYELAYLAKSGDTAALSSLVKFTEQMYDELLKHVTVEEAVAELVKAKVSDKIKGGLADKKKPSDFDSEAIKAGVKVEMEHTNDPDLAREIAMDHLTEDPHYYKKLKTIEKSSYGPKSISGEKVSLYSEKDNINRKSRRVGDVYENVGQNKAAYKFTPSAQGTFAQQADREAKRDKKKSKANPVKVYTPEERAALQAKIDEHNNRAKDKKEASEDNSKVVGKKNGHSVRKVHGYYRYTSGPKRGEYVHRHEAEKRLGRKLGAKEHVNHKSGRRGSTKNTEVMSASDHAAETNSKRANKKGYTGSKRYEHTRD